MISTDPGLSTSVALAVTPRYHPAMAPAQADKPLCFAIMPITTPEDAVSQYGGDHEHFVHVAEFIFKPAAELAGYQFVPAAVDSSRVIQAAIIDNLAHADVVLCDTSLWNANVFFELGIRVALNKPVALVRDSLTKDIPFDNTPVHCYEYDHRMEPWCLKEEIPKLSNHIKAAGRHDQNELWKFAGIQVTAQQSKAGDPEDAKLDLLLAEVAALRQQRFILPSPQLEPEMEIPSILRMEGEDRSAVEKVLEPYNAGPQGHGFEPMGIRRHKLYIATQTLPVNAARRELSLALVRLLEGVQGIVYVHPQSKAILARDEMAS